MKVFVNGQEHNLKLTDANGINWVVDFIGVWGGWPELDFNEEGNYTADEETFNFWAAAIERKQELDDRAEDLRQSLLGKEYVDLRLSEVDDPDLSDYLNLYEEAILNLED